MHVRTRALFAEAWPLLAVALALSACKGGKDPLVELSPIAAGDDCADGGYLVAVGVDADRDGQLSADEITGSEIVCSGANGAQGDHGTITSTTALDVGDADCPYGGLRLDAGTDDGAGGGVADDGILQEGEIATTELLCNGEPAVTVRDMEPPAGPAGAFVADLSGGAGTAESGGQGGSLALRFGNGPGGGGVKLFATGVAESPVAFPSTLTAYLGGAPVIVTASTTVVLDPATSTLADGALHMWTNDHRLYRWDDAGDAGVAVSGLRVAAGATLTLPMNAPGSSRAILELPFDLHLAGTLTTTDGSGGKVDLAANVGNWVGEATGRVDLAGAAGVDGRQLFVSASRCPNNLTGCGGAVFNRAQIDASGGDAASGAGGVGGYVYLESEIGTYNLGSIDASGGDATAGNGGNAGEVALDVELGAILNGGDVHVRGGNGVARGGYGGEAYFYSGSSGYVVNTGDVDARGGSTQPCADQTTCYAGNAGGVYAYLYSAVFVNTGNVDGRGGDAPLTANPTDAYAYAGAGGYLYVYVSSFGSGWWGSRVLHGDIQVSGDLAFGGGDGGFGGSGGWIDVRHNPYEVTGDQQIVFYGYPEVDASGGDGQRGGDGGVIGVSTNYGYDVTGGYTPGGFVVNTADLDASGGAGATANGGAGGEVFLGTDDYFFTDWSVLVNDGDIDARGGPSASVGNGGFGGDVVLWGIAGVTNRGAIDVSGAAGGWGGYGGSAQLLSDQGRVDNVGALTSHGGAGTLFGGGNGHLVELVGATVANAGALRANGGDSVTTDDRVGGDGGLLFLHSLWGTTQQTSTTLEIAAGSGASLGMHGQVILDGMNVTDDWTP